MNLMIMIIFSMNINVCLMISKNLGICVKILRKSLLHFTLDHENAKHDYEVAIENRNELQKRFDTAKSENEAITLELEIRDKALSECMNENATLKLSIEKKSKHCSHDCFRNKNRQYRKKHTHVTCYNCTRNKHISYYFSFKKNISSVKRIWVPKGSHVLSNHQGPIKVWVPKSST